MRDAHGIARDLIRDEHFLSNAGTVQLAAQEYLGASGHLLGLKAKELKNLCLPPESDPIDAGIEYRFLAEKPRFDTTTVAYYQTYLGLPVWQSGLAVHMKQAPFRIISAQATLDPEIQAAKPSDRAVARLNKLNAKSLAKVLGLGGGRSRSRPRRCGCCVSGS